MKYKTVYAPVQRLIWNYEYKFGIFSRCSTPTSDVKFYILLGNPVLPGNYEFPHIKVILHPYFRIFKQKTRQI